MKFIILLISLLFIDFCLFAQKGPLIFLGYAKDSISGVPLEKATIQLQKDKEVLRSLTDEKGYFKFENLSPGSYTISVDYTGYIHYARIIEIVDSTSSVSFFISLVHQDKLLQDIVITVTKSLVENKPDRIVYNVEKDITSQGGVATDVLRKIPQVTVDVNGNVELLGNPSIKFFINGKPSTIFGNNAADALQSIPASQIQSIEVMSSPGAKYDASGTGGIINIILKKNRSQGFSGIINVTAGSRIENGSLNLNYKKNNISFNTYFSGSAQVKVRTLSELTRNSVDTATKDNYFLHQQGSNDFKRNSYRAGWGMDWDITQQDNLSVS